MMPGSRTLSPLASKSPSPSRTSPTPPEKECQLHDSSLLFVGFNQDHGCFSIGTETGFRIYNCDPFKETFRRETNGAGIAIVEMLFRCNVLALVGGGKNPQYSPNKVMIWDDFQSRCIGELSFRSAVRAVKLRRERIVVVLEHKIYVYNFENLKVLHQIETLSNMTGLCALSSASTSCVLACPGQRRGEVRVELYSSKRTKFVQAHESSLACMALTANGALLATASTKGTLVFIFSTADGTKLQELRRGADRASIYSMAFSANAQWLVLSSDKGTVHVFAIKASNEEIRSDMGAGGTGSTTFASSGSGSSLLMAGSALLSFASANAGSSLSFMKGVLPKYFSSEWSFAQFRMPDDTRAIVAFGPQKHTILIACANGSFYRCSFDPVRGGEMQQQEFTSFTKAPPGDEKVTL